MVTNEYRYDIVVCGAGIAGIAAAIEAGRAGLRTALIEKSIIFGGLATAGLVNYYLPLCDGHGKQVTFGLAEEFLHLSLKYGPGDVPHTWKQSREGARHGRYSAMFSPASFVLAFDEILENSGIDIWLDTLVTYPIMTGKRVLGVEAESKAGRIVFRAGCVIDATGDADVAYRAGAKCVEELNTLSLWALELSLARAGRALIDGSAENLIEMTCFSNYEERWKGTDPKSVTTFALGARRMLRTRYNGEEYERQRLFPVTLPTMAQFRRTRRIIGQETMEEGQHGQRRSDSIGLTADWRTNGSVWEIPYGTMIPEGVKGLLVVGRCISADGDAWEVTRVIPPCALTGQVAGLAAAIGVRQTTSPEKLHVKTLQEELGKKGFAIHLDEIYHPQETS